MKKIVPLLIICFISLRCLAFTEFEVIDSTKYGNQTIILLKSVDKDYFVTNNDGTKFYKTKVLIRIRDFKDTKDVMIPYTSYANNSNSMNPCLIIDPIANKMCIFVLDKVKNGGYSMDGYAYFYSQSDNLLVKETVFSGANMGWFSFFVGSDNGNPQLWHFNFAGYHKMLSKRNSNGKWTTIDLGNISVANASDQYNNEKKLLISSTPAVGYVASAHNRTTQSSVSDNAVGIIVGAAVLYGLYKLLSPSKNGTDNDYSYHDNNSSQNSNRHLNKRDATSVTTTVSASETENNKDCYIKLETDGSWPEDHKNYRIIKNGTYTGKKLMIHSDQFGYSWSTEDKGSHERFKSRDAAAEDAIYYIYGEECSHYIKFE